MIERITDEELERIERRWTNAMSTSLDSLTRELLVKTDVPIIIAALRAERAENESLRDAYSQLRASTDAEMDRLRTTVDYLRSELGMPSEVEQ